MGSCIAYKRWQGFEEWNRGLLDVGLVGYDVDVDGHQEPEGSVAEGDGSEEFRPLRGWADDSGAVGDHHLELAADVLE